MPESISGSNNQISWSNLPQISNEQLQGFYNASMVNSIFQSQQQAQSQMQASSFKSSMSNMMQMMMMMKMMETMDGSGSSSGGLKEGKTVKIADLNSNTSSYKVTSLVKNGTQVESITLTDSDGNSIILNKDPNAPNRFTGGSISYVLSGTNLIERQSELTVGGTCDINMNGVMSSYTITKKPADEKSITIQDANGNSLKLTQDATDKTKYSNSSKGITVYYAENSLFTSNNPNGSS